jgi:H+/Cl- antiporter ClcA
MLQAYNHLKLLIILTVVSIAAIYGFSFYCKIFSFAALKAKLLHNVSPYIAFLITPLFFWISAYLCRKFSPASAGNSMVHVKMAFEEVQTKLINHKKILDVLNLKVILVKTISSIVCVLGGGALGREGPTVHMASALFSVIGNKFKKLSSHISLEGWLFAGSALGIAIAFYAPITGLFYVFEKSIILKVKKFKCFKRWFFGRFLKFQSKNFNLTIILSIIVILLYFNFADAKQMFKPYKYDIINSFRLFFIASMISAVCCVFVVIFKAVNFYLYFKFQSIKSNRWHLVPICTGLLVALISYHAGIYSFGGGIFTSSEVLANPDKVLTINEFSGRYVNTILTFVSGSAGGLIAPAITMGAGIGSIFTTLSSMIDSNVLILIGMTAFLAPILGAPLSTTVMIIEVTGHNYDMIPILFFTSFAANYLYKITKTKLSQYQRLNGPNSYFSIKS